MFTIIDYLCLAFFNTLAPLRTLNFKEINSHKEIIAKLTRTIDEGRVSHAQLFTGPEGCGSLAMAIAYAQYVSCENPHSGDSCGVCKSCLKYQKLIHPDFHFVFPVVKSKKFSEPISDNYIDKWREQVLQSPYFSINDWLNTIEAGNAQGQIPVAEASEILRKLSLKSYESDYKIMIIWQPERMHHATANKLLKLIEEPPAKTLFLLVSDDTDKLLPTIISRCQIVKIPAFTAEEIALYLTEQKGIDSKQAASIARVANGNINRAIELCANNEGSSQNDNFEMFIEIMRTAYKRNIIGVMRWAEQLAEIGREAQKSFLIYSLHLLRENIMLTLQQEKNDLLFLSDNEYTFSQKFHPFINEKNIFNLVNEFNLAYRDIESNGNAKIIFLDLGLKITKLLVV